MISEFANTISPEVSEMLNEIHLNNPSIQLEKVAELKNLDKTLTIFTKLITIFHAEYVSLIPEMKVCCDSDDFTTLSRLIHRFKSTTYNLGASRAVELSKQIELALNKKLCSHVQITQLITLLEHECVAAHEKLVSYLPNND